MRPDCRSNSFLWGRGLQNPNLPNINLNIRRGMQEKLEIETDTKNPFPKERSLRNTLSKFTLPSVGVQPGQAIRVGAERINKSLRDVRVTFDSLSQKLRRSTRRRLPLKNELSPRTPNTTPRTRSRQLLGRTPTKLYSPFGIDTPKRRENQRRFPPENRRTTPGDCFDSKKQRSNLRQTACKKDLNVSRKIF